jgi:hypothetical protein
MAAPMLADGPFRFYSVTPCRVLDTRPSNPLLHNTARNIQIRTASSCGIPAEAAAVAMNATIAAGGTAVPHRGYLIVWPFGLAQPVVSSLNWEVSGLPIANGVIVPLDADATPGGSDISALYFAQGGTASNSVQLILDVTGYFAPVTP